MGDDTVRVCPHCDSTPVYHRTGEGENGAETPQNSPYYYCAQCGEDFETPPERERYTPGSSGHEKLRRAGFGHLLDDGGESE